METETIDRLYLELSQFTQAKTAKEIALEARLATYEAALREIVDRSNNGIPGTAKVNDMRQIALKALGDAQ